MAAIDQLINDCLSELLSVVQKLMPAFARVVNQGTIIFIFHNSLETGGSRGVIMCNNTPSSEPNHSHRPAHVSLRAAI